MTKKTEEAVQKLTPAQVASRAQAAAHQHLRRKYPEEYQTQYQRAKKRLVKEASK